MQLECHITINAPAKNLELLKSTIINSTGSWTFSAITDDPYFGPGKFIYATMHGEVGAYSEVEIKDNMLRSALNLSKKLSEIGEIVLRIKIEKTVFDHRYS